MSASVRLALTCIGLAGLLLPSLIPAPIRTASIIAVGAGVVVRTLVDLAMGRWPKPWVGALLVSTVIMGAGLSLWYGVPDIRHVSGISAGLWVARLSAQSVSSEVHFRHVLAAIGVGSIIVLVTGLAGVEFLPVKFVFGADAWLHVYVSPHLPRYNYPIPGLEEGSVNLNALGGTAMILLPLTVASVIVSRRRQWDGMTLLTGFAALLCSVLIVLSLSRTVFYGTFLLAILAIVLLGRQRWDLLVLVVALAIGTAALASARDRTSLNWPSRLAQITESLEARQDLWNDAWMRLREAPLTGIGLGRFRWVTSLPDSPAHAHNQFLQVALDLGVVGLLAYVMTFGWAIRIGLIPTPDPTVNALSAGAAMSIIALHIFGLTDTIALGSKVGLIQWACLGLIAGLRTGSPWFQREMPSTI